MGLPRYLNDQYNQLKGKTRLPFHSLNTIVYIFGTKVYGKTYEIQKCYLKKAFKILTRYRYTCDHPVSCDVLFYKVPVNIFCYWEKRNEIWTRIIIEAKVSRYFLEKAEDYYRKKADKEWGLIIKKIELDRMRNIEQGRLFKGRLRHMIMERDEYKCVLCGISPKEGAVLEVDHILEWSDGGKTVYDNGQTICADCNKGKHHYKKYVSLEGSLRTVQ